VQRGGVTVNSLLSGELFYLKAVLANGVVEFSLDPNKRKISTLSNNNFPSRFRMQNLSKIDFMRVGEGKLVLTLVNYSRSSPDFTEFHLKPVHTLIYCSEASPDSLKDLANKLAAARLKRPRPDAEEVETQVTKRPLLAPKVRWTQLRRELLCLILSFVGLEDGQTLPKLRLLNKQWNKAMSLTSTQVKLLDGASCPGAIVSRVLKRNPKVKFLSLKNCSNFGSKEVKDARSFPLRRVLELNLKGCKKLNNSAIFSLLQMSPDLEELDLRACEGADGDLLTGLNSRVHFLKLRKLKLGRSFGDRCLGHVLSKFKLISSLSLDAVTFSEQVVELLAAAQLQELHCNITEVQVKRRVKPVVQEKLERLTLVFDEKLQSSYQVQCYEAFLSAPSLKFLSINLDLVRLEPHLSTYAFLTELRCVELPTTLPSSLRSLCISTRGLTLLIELESRADPGLGSLEEVIVLTKDRDCASRISEKLKHLYPSMKRRVQIKLG
jgi:hypothetical protein